MELKMTGSLCAFRTLKQVVMWAEQIISTVRHFSTVTFNLWCSVVGSTQHELSTFLLRWQEKAASGDTAGQRALSVCGFSFCGVSLSARVGPCRWLFVSLCEWWIQTNTTCWCEDLFPLMQEACARCPRAEVCVVCSCAAFWWINSLVICRRCWWCVSGP